MVLCKIRAITLIILWVKVFDMYLYNQKASGWLGSWTVFYWAWWIAWAPFVGMFIARISKGRTIREVVLGVCLIPLGFTLAWISIFGNTAIHLILNQKQKVLGDMVLSDPALSLFKLLEYLPFNPYIAGIVVVICFVLFLTPVGSGTLMIANLSSKGAPVIVIHRSGYASFGLWSLPL